MRQGQQHRRGRGRNNNNNNNNSSNSSNNNNRRGHNPLSRSFESNGPDVKVRGTPAHVAEKYLSLARDAQSSGDPVLAENYLQHAEHYNRIIMAYREQQVQQSGETANGGGPRLRQGGPSDGGEGDDVQDEEGDDLSQGEQPPMPRFQDQPRNDDGRSNRGGQDQPRFRDRQDRQDRHNDRQPDMRQGRDQGRDRAAEPQPQAEGGGQPRNDQMQRRRERFGPGNEQPEFLRRPVRRPRREGGNGDTEGAAEGGQHDSDPQDKTIV